MKNNYATTKVDTELNLYVVMGGRKRHVLRRWAAENGLKLKGWAFSADDESNGAIAHSKVGRVIKLVRRSGPAVELEMSYKPIRAVRKKALFNGEYIVGFVLWWNEDMTLVWPYIPRTTLNHIFTWNDLRENFLA